MGVLLSFFRHSSVVEADIDFEAPLVPQDPQLIELNQRIDDLLERGQDALRRIDEYKGCQEIARRAMNQSNEENDNAAFFALNEAAKDIVMFHEISQALSTEFTQLLYVLRSPPEEKKAALENHPALCKQLARLFEFALQFDQIRLTRPYLSNDFSFYRRILPRFIKRPDVAVKEDEANTLGMFTAEHIPMISAMYKAANAEKQRLGPSITSMLAVMANTCAKLIKSKRFSNPDTNLLCARAMTGCIIVFDHVDELGAFYKRSPIAIKTCVLILKREFPTQKGLLNSIRFSTKHFNDDTTPSGLQALFD